MSEPTLLDIWKMTAFLFYATKLRGKNGYVSFSKAWSRLSKKQKDEGMRWWGIFCKNR